MMIELEIVVDDLVTLGKTMADGPQDPHCQWAAHVEELARELFKGPPERIVFRYADEGIRLLVDGESKASLLTAVREIYGQMPASVQAFLLDVSATLRNGH